MLGLCMDGLLKWRVSVECTYDHIKSETIRYNDV